jgi:hypothetical protein
MKVRRVANVNNRLEVDGRGVSCNAQVRRNQVVRIRFVGKIALALFSAELLTLALPEPDLGWLA